MLGELLVSDESLPINSPLVAYGHESRVKVWTREHTTIALQKNVRVCGLESNKYVLHFRRIEGATQLAMAGLGLSSIQQAGRWKSDCFKV
ncbi:unnamed protein product, partial [Choristocarpus tenellus]